MDGSNISISSALKGVCPCCNKHPIKKRFGLFEPTSELSFLGAGFPLYFDYLKFGISVLTISFVIVGVYMCWRFYLGNQCDFKANEADIKDCGSTWKF
jgi:hypothetical protein